MFSIIIPTLQQDNYVLNMLLYELLNSACVGEIIIINNACKEMMFSDKKIRVINTDKNIYVNPAWKLGIRESRFEYIGLLNDDIIFPKNIFEQIFNFIKQNSGIGLIGLDSINKTEKSEICGYPEDCEIKFSEVDVRGNCWGAAIFGRKSDFYEIPEDMKVWCGDDYLFYQSIKSGKRNFKIYDTPIKHLHSNTCKLPEFDSIKRNDVKLYRQYFIENKADMQSKFDLIFSIGAACSCTQTLRTSFLQYYSYPFDWPYGSDFLSRVKILVNNFEHWLDKSDLASYGKRVDTHPNDIYKNARTNIVFNHDFKINTPLDESYSEVKEKYDRRIRRLLNQIEASKNILLVYIESPEKREETLQKDLIDSYHLLKNRFPNVDIHILYLFSTRGVSLNDKAITPVTDKITRISFDYDAYNREYPYAVNFDLLLEIFKNYELTSKHLTLKQHLLRFNGRLFMILRWIFSVRNEYQNNSKRKIIRIFGIRIKKSVKHKEK